MHLPMPRPRRLPSKRLDALYLNTPRLDGACSFQGTEHADAITVPGSWTGRD